MDGVIGERDVSKCCRWEGRWKENVKADDAGGGVMKRGRVDRYHKLGRW
jgi:hypothetical protein